jgi:hypothetical protein
MAAASQMHIAEIDVAVQIESDDARILNPRRASNR